MSDKRVDAYVGGLIDVLAREYPEGFTELAKDIDRSHRVVDLQQQHAITPEEAAEAMDQAMASILLASTMGL